MVRVWNVERDDVFTLVDRMLDPTRSDALVILSPASDSHRPRVDPEALAKELPPGTELAALASMQVSERLSDVAPSSSFHCYGGSVRVVRQGAHRTDHWRRHPMIFVYPDDDPADAIARIARAAEEASAPTTYASRLPGSPSTFDPTSAARLAEMRERLAAGSATVPIPPRTPERPKPGPGPRPAVPPPGPPVPAPPTPVVRAAPATDPAEGAPSGDSLARLLREQERRVVAEVRRTVEETIANLLGDNRADLERERSRADTAEQELSDVKSRLGAQRPQADSAELPGVYDDPERQLRWEIEHDWLTSGPESQRHPLKAYTLAPGFLDSLRSPIVPRAKARAAMIRVLTDQHWGISHQFAESVGGPKRVRDDGAVCWRTSIKQATPGAPRLTWWLLPGGAVEFEHAGHHDELIK
jgi:hypothetical protein